MSVKCHILKIWTLMPLLVLVVATVLLTWIVIFQPFCDITCEGIFHGRIGLLRSCLSLEGNISNTNTTNDDCVFMGLSKTISVNFRTLQMLSVMGMVASQLTTLVLCLYMVAPPAAHEKAHYAMAFAVFTPGILLSLGIGQALYAGGNADRIVDTLYSIHPDAPRCDSISLRSSTDKRETLIVVTLLLMFLSGILLLMGHLLHKASKSRPSNKSSSLRMMHVLYNSTAGDNIAYDATDCDIGQWDRSVSVKGRNQPVSAPEYKVDIMQLIKEHIEAAT